VAYWLDKVPAGLPDALLPADNPLVRAGPEIIPALLAAIHKSYGGRDFINRFRGYIPPFLQKRVGEQRPPAWQIRSLAAFRLGLMGSAASNAVPTLVGLLSKPSTYIGDKGRVIQALGFIGPSAEQAVPVLVENLDDQNEWILMTAAYSLLQIGTVPPEAIPTLKRNLSDRKSQAHVAALMAVALLAAEGTPETVSRVELMLTAKGDRNAREAVAADLSFLSSVPDELKPILTRMLDEEDASVRQGAALGLARPHADNLPRIIQVLVEGLENGQFQSRCARALGRIGPDAAVARRELENAQGYVLGIAARDALARIEGGAANVSQPIRSETNSTSSAAASRR